MAEHIFRCKQFEIHQHNAAQRITSDACVFGASIPAQKYNTILDIGTGTGLLALMLAQRSSAHVTAIEIDAIAFNQAWGNVRRSPFSSRVQVEHTSLQEWHSAKGATFECVVCNPPFFEGQLQSPESRRNKAAHSTELTLKVLCEIVNQICTQHFYVLYPTPTLKELLSIAKDCDFFCTSLLHIAHSEHHAPRRSCVQLSKEPAACTESTLATRNQDGSYSAQYRQLLSDYFLEF